MFRNERILNDSRQRSLFGGVVPGYLSRCLKKSVHGIHLFIFTNNSISTRSYLYAVMINWQTTWSNNGPNALFGSGQTRVRVSRQRRTTDSPQRTTRTKIASETFEKLLAMSRGKIPFTTGGYLEWDYVNFGNWIRIPNRLINPL